jgi:hypothetical protein
VSRAKPWYPTPFPLSLFYISGRSGEARKGETLLLILVLYLFKVVHRLETRMPRGFADDWLFKHVRFTTKTCEVYDYVCEVYDCYAQALQ